MAWLLSCIGQNAPMRKPITSGPTSLVIAVLAAMALFAGGCSSKGGDDAKKDDTTTTAAAAEGSTTTGAEEEAPTTTEAEAGDVTSDDLEAILPTVSDLGEGWSVDTTPDDESSAGPDLEELCPEAAAVRGEEDTDDDKVKVKFAHADTSEQIEVELSPSAKAYDQDELEAYAEALNDCTPSTTDEESGLDYSFRFEVNSLEDYGDQGLQLESHVKVSGESLPDLIEFTIYGLIFRSGAVGVEISGQDGISPTYEVSEFDPNQLITLADDLDPKVKDLVG